MLFDDITAALPELRAHAESLMTDSCTITRPGATPPVWDPATGTYSTPATVTLYAGPCRVQLQDVQESNPTAGEAEFTEQSVVVSIPLLPAVSVPLGAVVTVTAVGPMSDPTLVGARLSFVAPSSRKSQATARRLRCKEVLS